ncbi:unnamed protein product, partial [Prorocentrum cordatum]
MADEWPNWTNVEEIVKKEKFMSGNEEFTAFNKKVLKASPEEIAEQVEHAEAMWHFLIGFAGCKKIYKSKILQVFNKLMQVPSWVAVWEAQSGPLGDKFKALHADLQAALAVQSPVIMKSISPMAMASINQVSAMDRPEEIGRAMERDRLVDEIRKEAGPTNEAFGNDGGGGEASELSALQDGIDAVIALAGRTDGSVATLNRLRIGCIQCAGHEANFRQESKHAPEVFGFLLAFARREPASIHLVAEVMNPIMASPSWASVLEGNVILQESLRGLTADAQAALGLQSEALMKLISDDGRRKASGGEVSDKVKGVADKMKSIRWAADATAGEAARPSSPVKGHEWKAARTPEGHTYYFNAKTRESTWERPASLGGPHVYSVGEAVEVWSNSQRKWGRGVVEKVEGGTVTAEFTLPGGSAAKKELPATHKDLRPAEGGPAWPPDEEAAYRRLFDSLAGAPDAKPTAAVVEALRKSGLTSRALGQVWAVANPGNKADLGFEEFAKCCRLVAHCQAMAGSPVLAEADRPLRVKLRE